MQRLDEKLRMPGVTNIWTQPIRNRIDMLSTGIRTQVGVKVFGSDLAGHRAEGARDRKSSASDVPGAVDLYAERITALPILKSRRTGSCRSLRHQRWRKYRMSSKPPLGARISRP